MQGYPAYHWAHNESTPWQDVTKSLALFDTATQPNTTVVSPQRWASDHAWKDDFMDTSKLSPDVLEKLKKDYEKTRALKTAQT